MLFLCFDCNTTELVIETTGQLPVCGNCGSIFMIGVLGTKPGDDLNNLIKKIARARNRDKFDDLFDNGFHENNKNNFANDDGADLSFCNMLAYGCRMIGCSEADATARIDILFRETKLYEQRPRRWEKSNYRYMTIRKALSLYKPVRIT